jgi:secondary thiamine-phosphate synthase enzyme
LKIKFEEITFSSKKKFEIIDITSKVERTISKSGIENGFCIVHLPHATVSLILNENETNIRKDYEKALKEHFFNKEYQHDVIDDNAAAHVTSAIVGSTKVLQIKNGAIIRGTWQNLMILELDGPRARRRASIEIVGK